MTLALPHGTRILANVYGLNASMSRQFSLVMVTNRTKRSAALRRARQFARSLKTFKRQ